MQPIHLYLMEKKFTYNHTNMHISECTQNLSNAHMVSSTTIPARCATYLNGMGQGAGGRGQGAHLEIVSSAACTVSDTALRGSIKQGFGGAS